MTEGERVLRCLMRILSRPLLRHAIRLAVVVAPLLGDGRVQRVIRVGILKQQLNRQAHLVDLKSGTPEQQTRGHTATKQER